MNPEAEDGGDRGAVDGDVTAPDGKRDQVDGIATDLATASQF